MSLDSNIIVSKNIRKPKMNMMKQLKQNWQLYVLVALPILYIIIFKYIPMYGAQIAFRKFTPVKGITGSPWVGLANFIRFVKSPQFWVLTKNTLGLSIYSLIAGFPIPIILALALNYAVNQRFKKIVQMTTYIPHFISVVVMVGLLMQVLNTRTGAVNHIIKFFAGKPIDFIGNANYFRSLYVWSGIWQGAGWGSIIYIAALSGVSPELHEAATIDGATKLQRIWHVDIPSIIPTAVIMFILDAGKILSVGFEKVILMQNPLNTSVSEVIETYVYKISLGSPLGNYSYAAAIGLMQCVINFALIILVNRIAKKVSSTSLW